MKRSDVHNNRANALRPRWVCLLLPFSLCLLAGCLQAQTDTISGVINRYTRAAFIECTSNSAINVVDPYGFHVGDKILIVQIQGAGISLANDSTFGSITSNNNAGNYELAAIDQIHGRTFILHYELAHTYTVSGIVQIVRVPQYTNVVIRDTLKPQPWDGLVGGIVAFIASGTVTMNADINASGAGFRDGFTLAATRIDFRDYLIKTGRHSLPSIFVCRSSSDSGSFKGEGICRLDSMYSGAKGPAANAGGGGNAFNDGNKSSGGGGGGGNRGRGGNGGDAMDAAGYLYAGIGGDSLTYSNLVQQIYLGGSGGWGGLSHYPAIGPGSAGGGIVFIRADHIAGNNHSILARGAGSAHNGAEGMSPGGGGGAGGVVLLDVNSFTSSDTVDVRGGAGQDTYDCDATGGGGGGGCIWLSGSSATPANLTSHYGGGAAGVRLGTTISCTGSAQDGHAGHSGALLINLQIPEGTVLR